ncbi:MAG TPA: hypothetical protein VKK31_07015 [Thermoanaerobaculia bacterium]|nr:hypothetical protein [Thermoanaerobaculia bacterium]
MSPADSIPGLTAFQIKCLYVLELLLARRQIAASFEVVHGNRENYVVARLAPTDERLEVFIYEDEAGIFLGKDWHAFESVDFDSGAELIEKLLQGIERYLQDHGVS